KVHIQTGDVEVPNRTGRGAHDSAKPQACRTSEQPDEAAQQKPLTGLEWEIAVGLLLGNLSISTFRDHLRCVGGNAVLIVQLVNGTQTLIGPCFTVENNSQQSFHDTLSSRN